MTLTNQDIENIYQESLKKDVVKKPKIFEINQKIKEGVKNGKKNHKNRIWYTST